jgi:hypothetical protein
MINLVLLINAGTLSLADTYRDTLATIFKPLSSTPIKLRVTRDDGEVRQIDTYCVGGVGMGAEPGERFSATQRVMVQLQASNPIWYDPSIVVQNIVADPLGWQVPWEVPFDVISSTDISSTSTITYTGTWIEYPVILLTGPGVSFVITNNATGEVLDFTGVTISAGDTYTIDLRYGSKEITDSAGANKIADITAASDLATWHLAADPEASAGVNDISVAVASGATVATAVSTRYYKRYGHL